MIKVRINCWKIWCEHTSNNIIIYVYIFIFHPKYFFICLRQLYCKALNKNATVTVVFFTCRKIKDSGSNHFISRDSSECWDWKRTHPEARDQCLKNTLAFAWRTSREESAPGRWSTSTVTELLLNHRCQRNDRHSELLGHHRHSSKLEAAQRPREQCASY